jgi:hypothetical protein
MMDIEYLGVSSGCLHMISPYMEVILRLQNLQLQRQRCSTYAIAFFKVEENAFVFKMHCKFLQRWHCNLRSYDATTAVFTTRTLSLLEKFFKYEKNFMCCKFLQCWRCNTRSYDWILGPLPIFCKCHTDLNRTGECYYPLHK